MLDHVDNLLRQLLIDRIDEISDDAQVRFQPSPVSVTRDPSAVFTRRFDEVVELRRVFDQAVAMVGNPRALKATELKARINANVRDIIQNGRSVEGLMVRDALTAQGFEFQPGRDIVAVQQSPPSNTPQRIATEGAAWPAPGASAQQRVRIVDPNAEAHEVDDALTGDLKKKKRIQP
ncbi:MAG: hypothetical protein LH470_12420 [Lysobacter sp.]|nr:hypothetical protein [Lysobacter sp.]